MSEMQTAMQNKALENLVSDIYGYAKSKAKIVIKKWDTKRKMVTLFTHINKVRLVKTLWQVDKAVDLNSFYCDSHLVIDKKRIKINRLADIPGNKNLLIHGIAGQGKSIFLRYLCSKTLQEGDVVPVFVELRKIQKGETLVSHIISFLEIIKIEIEQDVFEYLASKGSIVVFLDGFDEISEEIRLNIIREIEHLASIHEKLRIIVTSRVDGGLEMSAYFMTVRLDNLRNSEYKNVIIKLSETEEFAKSLIKQIESNKVNLRELLFTPLLVTLLIMSYKSYQELPEQLSDFYDSIFQVLLQRHDGAKPGFKRARRCRINDTQYRELFENICFDSKKLSKSIFTHKEIYDIILKSIRIQNISEDAESYLTDIVKVTCLLMNEGNDYRFIHKSVQEYYAASFIRNKPDIIAKQFYSKCFHRRIVYRWEQELLFLKEIDAYRYCKYYTIPLNCKILRIVKNNIPEVWPQLTIEMLSEFYENVELGFEKDNDGNFIIKMAQLAYYEMEYFSNSLWGFANDTVSKLLKHDQIEYSIVPNKLLSDGNLENDSSLYLVKIENLLKNDLTKEVLFNIAKKDVDKYFNELIAALKYVEKNDNYDLDLGL